jgi:DNA ligase-1
MNDFARLLDQLSYAAARHRKLELLRQYFANRPDPERGYALAILTGGLRFPDVKSQALRQLVSAQLDPILFALSYDYVGDLAETIALLWPTPQVLTNAAPSHSNDYLPDLPHVIESLMQAKRADVGMLITPWLNAANQTERWALLKLVTGGLRVGVSERMAKIALTQLGQNISVEEIEELWHGLKPPYADLFAWLEGRAEKPDSVTALAFRPVMLAHPFEEEDLKTIHPESYVAEWKWDGIRVQFSGDGQQVALYTRTGEDILPAFPDLAGLRVHGVFDGELLVMRDGMVAPFNDLQQRLNRKSPPPKLMAEYPAHLRLYDMLFDGAEDIRPLSFIERRTRLERWFAAHVDERIDISPVVEFTSRDDLLQRLDIIRTDLKYMQVEGFMLKKRSSPYLAGRPKGHWYKWKRETLKADVVMMYAQRGHGKRSSYYSDYTFGAWSDEAGERVLVPVGKAYSGYTDKELTQLDQWIRAHTLQRFGPVREVEKALVLEVEFDALSRSTRHKSGVAMRFPRIHRIRWDKPAEEAETLQDLLRYLESSP